MSASTGAAQRIAAAVTSWPGVESGIGTRGELSFKVGRREIGHLHGDHAAHFFFPKDVWLELRWDGWIEEHPVFPGRIGPAARRITDQRDVDDVVTMMRLNYDRVTDGQRAAVPGRAA
jgi:hypothetical protein